MPYDPSMDAALKRLCRELFPRGVPHAVTLARLRGAAAPPGGSADEENKIIAFPATFRRWVYDHSLLRACASAGDTFFENDAVTIENVPGTHQATLKRTNDHVLLTIMAQSPEKLLVGKKFTLSLPDGQSIEFEFERCSGTVMATVEFKRFTEIGDFSTFNITPVKTL